MDRNLEHFEARLDKDEYSKQDVAKMLLNEADFTASKTKKDYEGFVSREDFDKMSTDLATVKAELDPYKAADFDKLASTEFAKLNGDSERLGDFKTLAGLDGSEDAEAVLAKATEMKTSGKYDFMFSTEDSGAVKTVTHQGDAKAPKKGPITPSIGSFNLFKKNK